MSMLLLKHISDLNFWHASMYMYVKQLLVCSDKKKLQSNLPMWSPFLVLFRLRANHLAEARDKKKWIQTSEFNE
jgi:hypothetical protein